MVLIKVLHFVVVDVVIVLKEKFMEKSEEKPELVGIK